MSRTMQVTGCIKCPMGFTTYSRGWYCLHPDGPEDPEECGSMDGDVAPKEAPAWCPLRSRPITLALVGTREGGT